MFINTSDSKEKWHASIGSHCLESCEPTLSLIDILLKWCFCLVPNFYVLGRHWVFVNCHLYNERKFGFKFVLITVFAIPKPHENQALSNTYPKTRFRCSSSCLLLSQFCNNIFSSHFSSSLSFNLTITIQPMSLAKTY